MNGSASRPCSATMNGTLCAIRAATKATSRDRRSSLATTTLHFADLAAERAAASFGRRSRASAPLPVSASTKLGDDRERFGLGEALNSGALRIDAKAEALLSLRRNPQYATTRSMFKGHTTVCLWSG